ncbi:MAG: 3-hydroxyacyl-CoA dehydrogenase [Pseudomonadota bacterium]
MKSPDAPEYCLGIAGLGAMGQGIAQVAAMGGVRVRLLDARAGAADAARKAVAARIDRLVEKGRLGTEAAAAAIACLEPVESVADLAPADAIVEAVYEDLELKRRLFAEIEAAVGPDCLIASNTSSIPIAAIARGCARRERIAGLHFFNPVPLMKLVEVIRAAETSDETVAALTALGRRMTRTPVTVKDSPGFLVNMGGRAFTTEALRIAHERIAAPAEIDAIMRDCWGYRMGPFELMDLTGIDVNYPVSQIVWEGYQRDPRLATSPNHKAMFDAGLLGRKTGQGWYRYAEGKPVDAPSPDHVTAEPPARRVALAPYDAALAEVQEPAAGVDPARLAAFCAEIGLEIGPDDGICPILAAPVGQDASHLAAEARLDPRRLVCLDLLGDTHARVTIMTAPGADPSIRGAVAAAIAGSRRRVTAIADSAGFVGQRISAMVANLGCYMAEIGLASPGDVDTAMQLGLNYPRGPLGLTDHLGPAAVHEILDHLQASTGDPRYRPTPWLTRRALLGLPATTEA